MGAGDTATVEKRDSTRNLCFRIGFNNFQNTQVAGLTLPPNWGNPRAVLFANGTCDTASTGTPATGMMGSIAWASPDGGGGFPQAANVDVVLTFPSGTSPVSETVRADNVPMGGCR
jgi:hypothetical protein